MANSSPFRDQIRATLPVDSGKQVKCPKRFVRCLRAGGLQNSRVSAWIAGPESPGVLGDEDYSIPLAAASNIRLPASVDRGAASSRGGSAPDPA